MPAAADMGGGDAAVTAAARAATPRLPHILEVKRTLAGAEKRFDCAILGSAGTHVVVLFVAPADMNVHGVALPAGTVTFGHFWTDRPYNVYHWLDGATGATLGYYFNLADETRVEGGRLEWRDLAVDVLALPDGGAPRVLDEDEIPVDAAPALRARIAAAKNDVLRDPAALIAELEQHRRALLPRMAALAGAAPSDDDRDDDDDGRDDAEAKR